MKVWLSLVFLQHYLGLSPLIAVNTCTSRHLAPLFHSSILMNSVFLKIRLLLFDHSVAIVVQLLCKKDRMDADELSLSSSHQQPHPKMWPILSTDGHRPFSPQSALLPVGYQQHQVANTLETQPLGCMSLLPTLWDYQHINLLPRLIFTELNHQAERQRVWLSSETCL